MRREMLGSALLFASLVSCGMIAPGEGERPPRESPPPGSDVPVDTPVVPGAPAIFATGIRTNDILVDAQNLYVHEAAGSPHGCVLKLAKSDASVTKLACDLGLSTTLAGDETTLYLNTAGGVEAVAKAGGALRSVAPGRAFGALDRSRLYWSWSDSGSMENPKPVVSKLFAIGKLGEGEAVLLEPPEGTGIGQTLAADDSGVYFLLGHDLVVLAPGTATPRKVADMTGVFGFVSRFALDSDSVYLGSEEKVSRVSKAGGSPVVLASVQGHSHGFAVDDRHVYFTDTQRGVLARVPKMGGPTEVLATGQARPTATAVDDTHVYWANGATETLMKLAK
jgi:hypothetical protein